MTKINREMSSLDNLVSDLYSSGYQRIGEGFYSQVYAHPNKADGDTVIKVTYTDRLDWTWLDGWLTYLFGFIMVDEAYQSPHLPLVYDVTFYDDGYSATMERLVPITCPEYYEAMQLPIVSDITHYGHGHTDLHQANIMKRVSENGIVCLVVTDPYC